MVFFLKLKLNYLSKMHGYPQFSFWIPRILAKIDFLYSRNNNSRHRPLLSLKTGNEAKVKVENSINTVL